MKELTLFLEIFNPDKQCLYEFARPQWERAIKYANAVDSMVDALHQISLCSQNSMSSKEECGRIARAAIAKAKGEA